MGRRNNDDAELLKNYQCMITLQLPFIEPEEIIPCGHIFDKKSLDNFLENNSKPSCPCCRGDVLWKRPPSHITMAAFESFLSKNSKSYSDVYFDLDRFKEIVQTNELVKPIGTRFLTVLENESNYLNAAIAILASTLQGRKLLRKKFEHKSDRYLFGNAEISTESLQIQVDGKSILEWLSMTTEMDESETNAAERILAAIKEADAIKARIENNANEIMANMERVFNHSRLFLLRSALSNNRKYSSAVNPILKQVVYGKQSEVKAALEAAKSNAVWLSILLSSTGRAIDYSNRTIIGMTLLQAAAAAGDIEMCQMLKSYMDPAEFSHQLADLFPEGIKAHVEKQQQAAFNFNPLISLIKAASPADLDAALNQTNNGSALCNALDEFREQFKQVAQDEIIFNPYHLLSAYAYNKQLYSCTRGYDPKNNLFWCQIVGYIQRFIPACYAQAFVQGLYFLVKADHCYQGDNFHPQALQRNLKFKHEPGSYFSDDLTSSPSVCPGLGFNVAILGGGV